VLAPADRTLADLAAAAAALVAEGGWGGGVPPPAAAALAFALAPGAVLAPGVAPALCLPPSETVGAAAARLADPRAQLALVMRRV
jgi:hypothetical protein